MMTPETAFRQLHDANPFPDPDLLTGVPEDLGGLLLATKQSSEDSPAPIAVTPRPRQTRSLRLAVAGLAVAIVIAAFGLISSLGSSSDVVDDGPLPPPSTVVQTTVPAMERAESTSGGEPTQVVNDQGSRAMLSFAGDAKALVDGGAHRVEIHVEIEANTNQSTVTASLTSIDGTIVSTGTYGSDVTFVPTWSWTADGDHVVITMTGRGVAVPDTRPAVIVIVQLTEESTPVEYVLTAASGVNPSGSSG
ncbi:MAG: hypothetical protein ACR2NL_01855 [Acidimicrobiia bacterium]